MERRGPPRPVRATPVSPGKPTMKITRSCSILQIHQPGGLNHTCAKCGRRAMCLFPDGTGPCCFDLEAYRRKPLPLTEKEKAAAKQRKARARKRKRIK
jgi:hypothetical protein